MCRYERSHNDRLYVFVLVYLLDSSKSTVLFSALGAGPVERLSGLEEWGQGDGESVAKCCHVETDTGSYAVHNVLRETTFMHITHTEITVLVS